MNDRPSVFDRSGSSSSDDASLPQWTLPTQTGQHSGFAQIDDHNLRILVDEFYAKVRSDAELGPIFARVIGAEWDEHLAKMTDFWSSVMLTSGRYKGNPVLAHLRLKDVRPPLFDRWLALFGETCSELYEETAAEALRAKAARIAESLKIAMFYRVEERPPNPL